MRGQGAIGGLIAAGIALAALFTLMTVYAPDISRSRDGGAHALSPAGTGFSAVVALATAMDMDVRIAREPSAAAKAGLLVLTPAAGTDAKAVAALVATRRGQRVLIVLPKWRTGQLAAHPGWVERQGLLSALETAAPMAKVAELAVRATPGGGGLTGDLETGAVAPKPLHSISGAGLTPVLAGAGGSVVLGSLTGRDVYVLADPDLLANHALRDPVRARAALALLAALADDAPGGIAFDVTLNGYGRSPDLLRLAFEPPFLAMTLCLLVAAALAGVRAATRFGAPAAPPPPYAMGKRALADTAADLLRMAGREPAMAARYAALMLGIAARARGAPPGLEDAALAGWLQRRGGGGDDYAALAAEAGAVRNRDAALGVAQSLHGWQIANGIPITIIRDTT